MSYREETYEIYKLTQLLLKQIGEGKECPEHLFRLGLSAVKWRAMIDRDDKYYKKRYEKEQNKCLDIVK